jgi:hypothetical protein
MKCPSCFSLNADSDTECVFCHSPLRRRAATTPEWAYLFVVLCGAIPVISLGGAIPAVIGGGGAGLCLTVARAHSWSKGLRMFLCLGITVVAWFLFVAMISAVMRLR